MNCFPEVTTEFSWLHGLGKRYNNFVTTEFVTTCTAIATTDGDAVITATVAADADSCVLSQC